MKNKLFFIFAMTLGFVTNAQELELLSKQTAVSEVLENNFGVVIAKNNVAVAENNKGILNSGFLPSLTGNAGASYNIEDQVVTFQDGAINEVNGAETERYNASLNLNYVLFDGLGRWYDYKRLKELYNLSELQARETIETTLLQLFSVYFEVARLTENEEILKQTYNNTKDRLTRAKYTFEYGQSNKLDVLNAEVDLANDSINLMLGRQQLLNAKRDLTVVLNAELDRNFRVDTTVNFIGALKVQEFMGKADTNNVRLLQAEKNTSISSYNLKANKSVFLPAIGLTGSYGWNEGFFPSTSFLSSNNTTGLSAGVSLSWDLFDGGRGITTVKNAKIQLASQELLLEQIKVEVKRDIANAYGSYQNRLRIFELLAQNVKTATNNYERSLERFKLSQITSVELRQAQINLLNAQTNKNLAKYEAKISELELLQLTGQLLNVTF
jgi:outer membrane protein